MPPAQCPQPGCVSAGWNSFRGGSMENLGKYGEIWGNQGEIRENQGKIWGNQGKSGEIRENQGKIWGNQGKTGKIRDNQGCSPTSNSTTPSLLSFMVSLFPVNKKPVCTKALTRTIRSKRSNKEAPKKDPTPSKVLEAAPVFQRLSAVVSPG